MKPLVLASHPDVTSVSDGPSSPHSGCHSEPVTLLRVVTPIVCGFLSTIMGNVKIATRDASTHDRTIRIIFRRALTPATSHCDGRGWRPQACGPTVTGPMVSVTV